MTDGWEVCRRPVSGCDPDWLQAEARVQSSGELGKAGPGTAVAVRTRG